MNFKKFKIKGKFWSLSDHYVITDENGMEAYIVNGKKFAFRKKLFFNDWKGRELFLIEKKTFAWRPTFFLKKDGKELFKVVKKISFKPKIIVESLTDPEAFEVIGNLWGNEYKFLRSGEEFAFVSKDIWKMAGTYGVAVAESEEESTVLALVVIIDVIRQMEAAGAGAS